MGNLDLQNVYLVISTESTDKPIGKISQDVFEANSLLCPYYNKIMPFQCITLQKFSHYALILKSIHVYM